MSFERVTLKREADNIFGFVDIKVAVHPSSNGVIIVNYPAFNDDLNGRRNRYRNLGDYLQREELGAVVRVGNLFCTDLPHPEVILDNLRFVIDYALEHAEEISGSDSPRVFLMGHGAGASAIATIAADYSEVEKILLIGPSFDMDQKTLTESLRRYRGRAYIAIGENDEVVGIDSGQIFYDMASNSRLRKLVTVPNCDHHFRKEHHTRVLSRAPFWAFDGDISFPFSDKGISLY